MLYFHCFIVDSIPCSNGFFHYPLEALNLVLSKHLSVHEIRSRRATERMCSSSGVLRLAADPRRTRILCALRGLCLFLSFPTFYNIYFPYMTFLPTVKWVNFGCWMQLDWRKCSSWVGSGRLLRMDQANRVSYATFWNIFSSQTTLNMLFYFVFCAWGMRYNVNYSRGLLVVVNYNII